MKIQKTEHGYVAFITVLMIAALVLGLLLSLPLITTDTLKSVLSLKKGIKTREVAKSCAEIAFLEIQRDINYIGESLSIEPGSCIISVTDTASGKDISVEASVEEYTKTLTIQIEVLAKSINVTSWQIS